MNKRLSLYKRHRFPPNVIDYSEREACPWGTTRLCVLKMCYGQIINAVIENRTSEEVNLPVPTRALSYAALPAKLRKSE